MKQYQKQIGSATGFVSTSIKSSKKYVTISIAISLALVVLKIVSFVHMASKKKDNRTWAEIGIGVIEFLIELGLVFILMIVFRFTSRL